MNIQRKPYLGDLLPLAHQGKVRDTYAIPGHNEFLLMVATDAVSTHNVVHKSMVPHKGEVLTAMTYFWSSQGWFESHVVSTGKDIYELLPKGVVYPDDLHLRAMVVRKLEMIPVEFIFRSRLAGSLYKLYSSGAPNPYGFELPPGLHLMSQFDQQMKVFFQGKGSSSRQNTWDARITGKHYASLGNLVFTPTDKSATDEPLRADEVMVVDRDAFDLTLSAYNAGAQYAREHGIEIVDAKFEAGLHRMTPLLGDEFLTPDSCRFVEADKIVVGEEPPWMDKENLRKAAMQAWGDGPKTPLEFSSYDIDVTSVRYLSIFQRLVGMPLSFYQQKYL